MARILLIEDNNDIQEILYSLLSEDHEVLQAFSGTEGLRLFQQEGVDLVLLDIMLPGKNGDQVLEKIRLQSQTPVIMMTALGDKQLISQYLLAGANDYIVKPFNLDEVAARVTVQLRNQAVWEEVYLPGDNTLNAQLSNLRKKIAQLDPDEDYIETVWGLGVRLKGDK